MNKRDITSFKKMISQDEIKCLSCGRMMIRNKNYPTRYNRRLECSGRIECNGTLYLVNTRWRKGYEYYFQDWDYVIFSYIGERFTKLDDITLANKFLTLKQAWKKWNRLKILL